MVFPVDIGESRAKLMVYLAPVARSPVHERVTLLVANAVFEHFPGQHVHDAASIIGDDSSINLANQGDEKITAVLREL